MATDSPTIHTIPPTAPHTHTIIFLHGRDSLAPEFASELFESQASSGLTLPQLLPSWRWVFPGAGRRPSARFGQALRQWFDVWSVEEPEARKELQRPGLAESVEGLLAVVEREAEVVGWRRVVLAGISMGCATAVHVLLRGGQRVGAFVGLCGWLPLAAEVEGVAGCETVEERGRRLRGLLPGRSTVGGDGVNGAWETPVLLKSCEDDDMVPIRNGERLCKGLRGLGMVVEWHAYVDGGHWINEPKGVDDMVAFLKREC
ncbi:alpha/beta-hydrolase [Neofusicoccum parvum]|uniref:Alpha/beta-hydrolase n=1 Tax=Neofusicoccum parvum TaxID=310453 RepID=A0ACB5S5U9_9PEZI|nr:alpha/beta-hydrolase [Neofusicoccum parvum]